MKVSIILSSTVAAAALGLAGAASAGTIFDNPYVIGNGGDCSWSTTCASVAARGDDFAAQKFTLGSAAIITDASFTELDLGTTPTDVSWGIIMADGAGGLPGTILAAGTDTLTSTSSLGTDPNFNLNITQGFFNMGTVALGPGTYYIAMQGISSDFNTFLGFGKAISGAAETHDGGVTWASQYEFGNSVAMALYGTGGGFGGVPEPGVWAMMLVGLGGLGAALRRRQSKAAA
jgi:hypothetical protein